MSCHPCARSPTTTMCQCTSAAQTTPLKKKEAILANKDEDYGQVGYDKDGAREKEAVAKAVVAKGVADCEQYLNVNLDNKTSSCAAKHDLGLDVQPTISRPAFPS